MIPSKILSEYLSTISELIVCLKDSELLAGLNLHNKAHCQGEKSHYYYWMQGYLTISGKFSQRNNSNEKYIKKKSHLPIIKSSKNIFLERLSPLSMNKKKAFCTTSNLEDIIQGRNKYLALYRKEKLSI